jgi:hypothetical protein
VASVVRDPIPAGFRVVRGVNPKPDKPLLGDGDYLRRRARTARNDPRFGVWGITVIPAHPDTTTETHMRAAGLKHDFVAFAAVDDLRGAGFEVVWSGRHPHATLVFPDEPTDDDASALSGIFGGATANAALEEGDEE